jgi:hypothetical protein
MGRGGLVSAFHVLHDIAATGEGVVRPREG